MSKYVVAGLRCDGDYLDNGFNSLAHAIGGVANVYKGQYVKGQIGRPSGYKLPGSKYLDRKLVNGKWQYVYTRSQKKNSNASSEYEREKAFNSRKNDYFGRSTSGQSSSNSTSIGSNRSIPKNSNASSEYEREKAFNSRKNDYFGLGPNPGIVTYDSKTGQSVPASSQTPSNNIGNAAQNIWNGVSGTAQNIGTGIGNAAQNIWNGVSGTAQNIGTGIGNAAQNAWNGVSGIASNVRDALDMADYRVSDWMQDRAEDIGSLVGLHKPDSEFYKTSQLIADPNNIVLGVGFPKGTTQEDIRNEYRDDIRRADRINDFRDNVGSAIQNVGNTIGNAAQNAWNGVSGAAQNVGGAIQNAGNWLGDTARNAWAGVTDWFGDRGEDIRSLVGAYNENDLRDLYNRYRAGDQEAIDDVNRRNAITGFRNSIGNTIGGAVQNIRNGADWTGERLQNAWNGVSGTAQNVGNAIGNTARNAWNGVSGTSQNVGNTIGNAAQNAWNGVSGAAQNVGNTIGNAAQNAWNLVSGAIQNGENINPSRIATMDDATLSAISNNLSRRVAEYLNSGTPLNSPEFISLVNMDQLFRNEREKRFYSHLK